MDPQIVGAALFAAGWVVGHGTGRRRHPKSKAVKPVCQCGHPLALHNQETSACHGTHERTKYDRDGFDVGEYHVDCTCQRYIGPEPLPELWIPEA